MSLTPATRREFLVAAARLFGGGWAAANLSLLAGLSGCARDAAARGDALTVLSPREGRTLGAFADRILPPDDELPGASEAGAVHFADRFLAELMPPALPQVQAGLAELDRRAGGDFAALGPEQQDAVIRAVEQTPFFYVGRMIVLAGVFADPEYGGNRDGAGLRVLGVEHHGANQPPFGWYDAEYARSRGGAA